MSLTAEELRARLTCVQERASADPSFAQECVKMIFPKMAEHCKLVKTVNEKASSSQKKRGARPGRKDQGSYLAIKPQWLFRVLKGDKTVELRKTALGASKTVHVGYGLKVYGKVVVGPSSLLTVQDLRTDENFAKHRVLPNSLDEYADGAECLHVWPVSDVKVFKEAITLPAKKGAIIFRNFDDADAALVADAEMITSEEEARSRVENYEREELARHEPVGKKRKPKSGSKRSRR